jgi:TRAP transporter 4TM/12TM fusion protein
MVVHFQSLKSGLTGLPDEAIPERRDVLRRLYYLVPVGILVYLLYDGMSIKRSIIYAIAVMFVVTMLFKESRLFDPTKDDHEVTSNPFVNGIELTAKRAAPIVVAATCIGIVLGVIGMTGVGIAISSVVADIAGTHLLLALLLTMILSIMFGMAVDTVTVYILLAVLVAPGLENIGVPKLTAHLFIFYFGLMAMVTPPVCIAAYAASTIAESSPIRSGFWAWKLSLGAFLLPFAFVYDPGLLLIGSNSSVAISIVGAVISFTALAGAIVGFVYTKVTLPERAALLAGSLLLIHPDPLWKGAGLALALVGGARQLSKLRPGESRAPVAADAD